MIRTRRNKKASVLILAVWTLMLLTTLAATIGLRVRSRMGVLKRIEERSRHHYLAEAGIKTAIASLRFDEKRYPQGQEASSKEYRYNNPDLFSSVQLEENVTQVGYEVDHERHFGVIDEERKINVNTVDRITFVRLIEQVSVRPEEEIKSIVEAVVNWREIHSTELVGFASDEYYTNLPQPYPVKHAPFELIDELMLIKGMDKQLYEQLRPFVTTYGDGVVNINTAGREVLVALGLTPELADKFIGARRGLDGKDATEDDHIFRNAHDVTREVQELLTLEKDEIIAIDFLNAAGKIKTSSDYYAITSTARLEHVPTPLTIQCVYNLRNNVIEYWKEKI